MVINELVLGWSSALSGLLGDLARVLPLGYAFTAGMVSSVNPCGFAMLPAYLGLFLGSGEETFRSRPAGERALWAVVVGASITAGFVVLFAVAGALISLGGRLLISIFPWAGLAVGVGIAALGLAMLLGHHPYAAWGQRLSGLFARPGQGGLRGFFLFGLAYGTASLSCTLPIFLTVVGISVATSSLAAAVGQFLLYALGMGSVLLALSLGLALFRQALAGGLKRRLGAIHRASALLLLLAGAYIVFYWLTEGGLLTG